MLIFFFFCFEAMDEAVAVEIGCSWGRWSTRCVDEVGRCVAVSTAFDRMQWAVVSLIFCYDLTQCGEVTLDSRFEKGASDEQGCEERALRVLFSIFSESYCFGVC